MKYVSPEEARTKIGNLRYLDDLRALARNNRKNPTKVEEIFWQLLSYKKLGYKFGRQKPIGRFILDFYCSKLLLAIEIDGGSHDTRENYDKGRDLYLEQRGIITSRFTNEEIENDINLVKRRLLEIIEKRKNELF